MDTNIHEYQFPLNASNPPGANTFHLRPRSHSHPGRSRPFAFIRVHSRFLLRLLPVLIFLFTSCSKAREEPTDIEMAPDRERPERQGPTPIPLTPAVETSAEPAPSAPAPDPNAFSLMRPPEDNLDNATLEELVQKALKATNPEYNGQGQIFMEGDKPIGAMLANTGISNLEAIEGIPFMSIDLQGCPVTDLSPLKGMPLIELFIDNTKVQSLVPLEGAKLNQLFANASPIDNIEVLAGMPLNKLNLFGTNVKDIRALEGAPLQEVWLNETPVEDISPLAKCPLITLTLHRTPVKDISPLANHPTLERLHIGETEITDLSPLVGNRLMRLIFTPSKITKGIPEIRATMTSLRELGTEFETKMNPQEFWRLYDEGAFK